MPQMWIRRRLLVSFILSLMLVSSFRAEVITMSRSPNLCNNSVEFPGLGCFSLDEPFSNTGWLPQSPSYIGLRFLLYTRHNPAIPDVLNAGNLSSITTSHFNSSRPVKLIVHGFFQYAEMDYIINMTSALLAKAPMNVVVVSWGRGAGIPYTQAVANTRVVGSATAQLIIRLKEATGITAQQVHVIGHSLGAHVGGYVGALVPGLGRITGLDPAQPNYSGYDKAVRLDETDATFVDVIHTDAVPYNTVQGYGIMEPVGHIDFYPNGGSYQPGCHEDNTVLDFVEDLVHNGLTNAEVSLSCSHERSTELFISSIRLSSSASTCSFHSFPCESERNYLNGECLSCGNRPCPKMGYDAMKSFGARGVYYLNTTDSYPFCAHTYFASLILDNSMASVDGRVFVQLRGTLGQLEWKLLKEGVFSRGDTLTNVFVSDSDIGEVNDINIRFRPRGNRIQFLDSSLVIRQAHVDCVRKFPRKYFCHSSMRATLHHDVVLSEGTFEESECLQ